MEPNRTDRFQEHLGLALAHLKLGKPEEARQWLSKAVDLMEQDPGTKTPRLSGRILRREVEELLRQPEEDNQGVGKKVGE